MIKAELRLIDGSTVTKEFNTRTELNDYLVSDEGKTQVKFVISIESSGASAYNRIFGGC